MMTSLHTFISIGLRSSTPLAQFVQGPRVEVELCLVREADGGCWRPDLGYRSFHFDVSLLVDLRCAGVRDGYNLSHFKLGNQPPKHSCNHGL